MCRGARLAEQDFGRLVGRSGSSLYLERFLSLGYDALPRALSHRVPHLKAWTGMRGFRRAMGNFAGQPPEMSTYFFSHSSALIGFAAECLFANAKRALITDLGWFPYADALRRNARKRHAQFLEVPLREFIRKPSVVKTDVVDYIVEYLQRHDCDGIFLSDITYDGIRLPVHELLRCLRARGSRPFAVIDGAQAFGQSPLDLGALNCDLYLAGTQKWLGAYHPLRLAFVANKDNLSSIQAVAASFPTDSTPDPLNRFTQSLEDNSFSSFGETVNLSAIIAAAAHYGRPNDGPSRHMTLGRCCKPMPRALWIGLTVMDGRLAKAPPLQAA